MMHRDSDSAQLAARGSDRLAARIGSWLGSWLARISSWLGPAHGSDRLVARIGFGLGSARGLDPGWDRLAGGVGRLDLAFGGVQRARAVAHGSENGPAQQGIQQFNSTFLLTSFCSGSSEGRF